MVDVCISRDEMMDDLSRFVVSMNVDNESMFMRFTEDFNGWKNGIWLCGECEDALDSNGVALFRYYADSYSFQSVNPYENYIFGVHPDVHNFVQERGWYFEWYDPGTLMLWQQ